MPLFSIVYAFIGFGHSGKQKLYFLADGLNDLLIELLVHQAFRCRDVVLAEVFVDKRLPGERARGFVARDKVEVKMRSFVAELGVIPPVRFPQLCECGLIRFDDGLEFEQLFRREVREIFLVGVQVADSPAEIGLVVIQYERPVLIFFNIEPVVGKVIHSSGYTQRDV